MTRQKKRHTNPLPQQSCFQLFANFHSRTGPHAELQKPGLPPDSSLTAERICLAGNVVTGSRQSTTGDRPQRHSLTSDASRARTSKGEGGGGDAPPFIHLSNSGQEKGQFKLSTKRDDGHHKEYKTVAFAVFEDVVFCQRGDTVSLTTSTPPPPHFSQVATHVVTRALVPTLCLELKGCVAQRPLQPPRPQVHVLLMHNRCHGWRRACTVGSVQVLYGPGGWPRALTTSHMPARAAGRTSHRERLELGRWMEWGQVG